MMNEIKIELLKMSKNKKKKFRIINSVKKNKNKRKCSLPRVSNFSPLG